MFDWWVQELEIANEGHQPDDIARYRVAFEAALARVEAAIAAPGAGALAAAGGPQSGESSDLQELSGI